jgi:diguanylate cyclase (GGDEF)-like protein
MIVSRFISVIDRDILTGAMSRNAFLKCITETIGISQEKGSSFVLLYIDIDNMKHFNNHNGHYLGDEMLKRFVTLVTPFLINPNLLFRFGGDEFTIILPNSSCEEALHLSQKICNMAREKLAPSQDPHCGDRYCMGPAKISVSIGISLFEQNMNVESLLRSVEQKMWDAKLAGRDCARI